MAWTIEFNATARKQLRKLDREVARRLVGFLETRVAVSDSPRAMGKALSGRWGRLWRYRVGDYRIVADIRDDVLTVLVVRVAHRRDAYR